MAGPWGLEIDQLHQRGDRLRLRDRVFRSASMRKRRGPSPRAQQFAPTFCPQSATVIAAVDTRRRRPSRPTRARTERHTVVTQPALSKCLQVGPHGVRVMVVVAVAPTHDAAGTRSPSVLASDLHLQGNTWTGTYSLSTGLACTLALDSSSLVLTDQCPDPFPVIIRYALTKNG
jgi:hypothetical protein